MQRLSYEQALAQQKCDILTLLQELAVGRVESLKEARNAAIKWALAQTNGNVAMTAEMLRTSRSTVYRFARKHRFCAA